MIRSRSIPHAKLWVLLSLMIAATVLCHQAIGSQSWTVRANLSVLTSGYLAFHLEDPSASNQADVARANAFLSKLVYRGRACVGYISPFGVFIASSDPPGSMPHDGVIILALLERVLLYVSVLILVYLVGASLWTRRRVTPDSETPSYADQKSSANPGRPAIGAAH